MLFSTPSSFEFCLKGTSKGKKDDTTRLSGGKKKRIRKALQKRSTFCKTLNIEERFFFCLFFVCVFLLIV